MQNRKLSALLKPLLIISFLISTSCAQVKIKNSQFCGDLGEDGAHCNKTLTVEPKDFPKAEWDAMRFGWICQPPQAFADQKTALQALCKRNNCSYEDQQAMDNFFLKVDEMNRLSKKYQKNSSETE